MRDNNGRAVVNMSKVRPDVRIVLARIMIEIRETLITTERSKMPVFEHTARAMRSTKSKDCSKSGQKFPADPKTN
jgi:hypothetical protein